LKSWITQNALAVGSIGILMLSAIVVPLRKDLWAVDEIESSTR